MMWLLTVILSSHLSADQFVGHPASRFCEELKGKVISYGYSKNFAEGGISNDSLCEIGGAKISPWTLFGAKTNGRMKAINAFILWRKPTEQGLTARGYCTSTGGTIETMTQ